MYEVTVEEMESDLARILEAVKQGAEVIVKENSIAVARLAPATPIDSRPEGQGRQPGSAKGQLIHMSEDFDEPLADFADYV